MTETKKRFIVFVGSDYVGYEGPEDSPSFDTLDEVHEYHSGVQGDGNTQIFDCEKRRVVETIRRGAPARL